MSVIEVLDPEFARSLTEQTALYLSSMRYLSSFIIFDDTSRLITRVGYIDDGYVRIRDAQDTSISLVEILRHMTWTSLSLAQLGATTAQPGESPPPSIVSVGGFDGSYIRMLRTDSDGRLQVGVASLPVTKGDWLSAIPNPPNLDVALSTRASEATLVAIRDRLPSSLTAAGNLKVSVEESAIKQPVDIQGHWVESVMLLPSGARTASGNTGDIDVGRFICAEVCLDVTAVSGTNPTLDFYLEGKDQLSGKYKTMWSQAGITAVGTYWLTITTLAFKYIRARWVISGTSPSFTFSVSMEGKS